jgi:hypothetical protein
MTEEEEDQLVEDYFSGDEIEEAIIETCGEPYTVMINREERCVIVSGPKGERVVDLDYMIHIHFFGEGGLH